MKSLPSALRQTRQVSIQPYSGSMTHLFASHSMVWAAAADYSKHCHLRLSLSSITKIRCMVIILHDIITLLLGLNFICETMLYFRCFHPVFSFLPQAGSALGMLRVVIILPDINVILSRIIRHFATQTHIVDKALVEVVGISKDSFMALTFPLYREHIETLIRARLNPL